MSEAIRCENCRWWNREYSHGHGGWCELNPPIYLDTGSEPDLFSSWWQPLTLPDEGCSRGEPKTQKTGETT